MIAIVHYHLEPGGVTTVILETSRLLTEKRIPHLILIGREPTRPLPGIPWQIIPGLDYTTGEKNIHLPPIQPTLWHIHNPTLGKNRNLPALINQLAATDQKILLHLHDLAEDNRPENLANIPDPQTLYPLANHIHYAFINTRDQQNFIASGLPAKNTHHLPNPISPIHLPPPTSANPFFLAPIRPIPRKNLPEILLLAALLKQINPQARIAITLAPSNPAHLPAYHHWKKLAQTLTLPLTFEAATHTPFHELRQQATYYLSTSTNEGFGLTFLDSAAHGKNLIARDIPHITRDHPAPIGHLYQKILTQKKQDFPTLTDHEKAHHIRHPENLLFENIKGNQQPATTWLHHALTTPSPTLTATQLTPYHPTTYLQNLLNTYRLIHQTTPTTITHLNHSLPSVYSEYSVVQ